MINIKFTLGQSSSLYLQVCHLPGVKLWRVFGSLPKSGCLCYPQGSARVWGRVSGVQEEIQVSHTKISIKTRLGDKNCREVPYRDILKQSVCGTFLEKS